MKFLMCGITLSLGILAGAASAELTLEVDGEEYTLSALMENCQTLADDPAAQIACFSAVSKLVEDQAAAEQEVIASVPEAMETLRAAAQYQDDDTGLTIAGSECYVQFLYYGNYFHISRRNVSAIDLFSATFDASQLQLDQMSFNGGGQSLLVRGVMIDGAAAKFVGGVDLESSQYGFDARSARMSIGDYAAQVANQLPLSESQAFDFVLVHPQRSQSSAEIWSAFESYVRACKN